VDDDASCGGDGSAAAPACSIEEALALFDAAARGVVHVAPGTYVFPAPLARATLPQFVGAPGAELAPPAAAAPCIDLLGIATLWVRGFRFAGCGTGVRAGTPTGAVVLVERCAFDDNGLGLECLNGSTCKLHDSTITRPRTAGVRSLGSRLTVVGTTIEGAGAPAGIWCQGQTCALERTRVIGGARAGLAVLDAELRVVNSAFVENGVAEAVGEWNGGVALSTAAARAFANNTVYGNRAGEGEVAGVRCSHPTTLLNSILWGNAGAQVDAKCAPVASDVDQDLPPGAGNFRLDPMLLSTASGAVDVHLKPGSPCVDRGDSAGAPARDIDGDDRPMGLKPDVGADEAE
jgi:hypothetical protein